MLCRFSIEKSHYFEGKKKRYEVSKVGKFTPLGDTLENILALLMAQKKITKLLPILT